MKKIQILVLAFMFITAYSYAQDALKTAIDDFHTTLAFTYHPLADENNFEPIKSRSRELADKAESIEDALEAMKKKPKELEKLVEPFAEQCEALDKVIKEGASDEAIRSRMNSIHERFHELEEAYFKAFPKK